MVDLHEALRPTTSVPPLPIEEVASRAERRRRRRRSTLTAVTCAGLGAIALVGALATVTPPESGVVADRPRVSPAGIDGTTPDVTPPESGSALTGSTQTTIDVGTGQSGTTGSTRASSSSTADPSITGESTVLSPGAVTEASTGIETSSTVTSQWYDGYCIQIGVQNVADDVRRWEVRFDPGGTITTSWNAESAAVVDGTVLFSGETGRNALIQPGAATTFGLCVDTAP